MTFRFNIRIFVLIPLLALATQLRASYLLLPMDQTQSNHLKAYGIAYWALSKKVDVQWLLNYRGGSFMLKNAPLIVKECQYRGVSFEVIADAQSTAILNEIANPAANMDAVKLETPPKIAVYSPKNKLPWDDAVTLVMTYAEIPYDVVYDEEVIGGELLQYDWLHLHHEDFTGQYGKFYRMYKNQPWYKEQKRLAEESASKLGFDKVSDLKLAVANKIREFTAGGGFLFAMCSGTDSYDIALAAEQVDICEHMFDGDPADPSAQGKLDFHNTFAFQNFILERDPNEYEFSSIDATNLHRTQYGPGDSKAHLDVFTLFDFSAKWDPVPSMLCQNHETIIHGFMGQTTAYVKQFVKPEVLVMGENKALGSAKYIHGEYGNGQWTFYGGHDPEDYTHYVGDPQTDLNLYPNSPGYRLILNNVLFPAARKKKQKT